MMIPPGALLILKKWWPVLAAAALFGTLLTLAYCKGESAGSTKQIVKEQKREIGVLTDVGEANAASAESRVEDTKRIALEEQELKNALEKTTDPDARRVLRGCVILRQQGGDTSRVPRCSRPATRR